jgi:hypothetical protein
LQHAHLPTAARAAQLQTCTQAFECAPWSAQLKLGNLPESCAVVKSYTLLLCSRTAVLPFPLSVAEHTGALYRLKHPTQTETQAVHTHRNQRTESQRIATVKSMHVSYAVYVTTSLYSLYCSLHSETAMHVAPTQPLPPALLLL